jgi:hypothetical protein
LPTSHGPETPNSVTAKGFFQPAARAQAHDRRHLGRIPGDDAHHRVACVLGLDHLGQFLEFAVDRLAAGGRGHALHLIAEAPHQHRRMVLPLLHRRAHLVALLLHHGRVVVAEAVALVADPHAGDDLQAELVRAVDQALAVDLLLHVLDAPGANRVAAARLK